MTRTIKSNLAIIQQKIKIFMLKNKIKKMESVPYLDLWERVELREAIQSLRGLEQRIQTINHTALFSLH